MLIKLKVLFFLPDRSIKVALVFLLLLPLKTCTVGFLLTKKNKNVNLSGPYMAEINK